MASTELGVIQRARCSCLWWRVPACAAVLHCAQLRTCQRTSLPGHGYTDVVGRHSLPGATLPIPTRRLLYDHRPDVPECSPHRYLAGEQCCYTGPLIHRKPDSQEHRYTGPDMINRLSLLCLANNQPVARMRASVQGQPYLTAFKAVGLTITWHKQAH
jgi:hypothetical protein